MRPVRPSLAWILALAAGLQSMPSHAAAAQRVWRIYTERAGLHRIDFEDLAGSEGILAPLPGSALSLDNQGRVQPFLLEDGGDGEFGPGDWLEFAAEIVPGETAYSHPYAQHNVYWLRSEPERARRLLRTTLPEQETLAAIVPVAPLRRQHLERDQLLIRLPAEEVVGTTEPELWYWSKLTHLATEPFVVDLDLEDADLATPISLAVAMRGLSEAPDIPGNAASTARNLRLKDHATSISSNGVALANASWDGRQTFVASRTSFTWPAGESPRQQLEIRVLERLDGDEPLVDVVMLDWVDVTYTHRGVLVGDQVELHIPPEEQGGVLELKGDPGDRLVVVGAHTGYFELDFPAVGSLRVPLSPRETSVWVRRGESAFRPISIELDLPSDLESFGRQADYLVIAHGSLLEAAEELVELHRSRGLAVALVDVQDIYDEFGAGIVAPKAIRDFLAYAYHNWQPPQPRFVLLMGDASWDTKNATVDDANYSNWVGRQLLNSDRFVAKATEDYAPERRNDRNLIPSWNYHTAEGHAASDAYYTFLAGDDELPDIALGRFPVATAEEVRAITAKIRQYIEAPLGPWRSRMVWISGALPSHQRRSIMLATDFGDRGLPATLILPAEKARPEDRAKILDAFSSGNLVTHFIGHGGRFIWRTGPPDLRNQADLFGLEDLEQLAESPALPVVLSVACYSAPFDHPSADSIGEAFLRLPGRGAIGFIGASWRNAPPMSLSTILASELSRPGTIGEALMRTKRQMTQRDSIHLFNLLGDPAVPIAAPQQQVQVGHQLVDGVLELDTRLPAEAAGGRAVITLLDSEGAPIDSIEQALEARDLHLSLSLGPQVHAVSVYFWNDATGADGVGVAVLDRSEETSPAPAGMD